MFEKLTRSDSFEEFFKWSGLICLIIAGFMAAVGLLSPRYDATITEASNTIVTYRGTRSRSGDWERVETRYVSVVYEGGDAENIRI